MMKKVFFVLAILAVTVTSALAVLPSEVNAPLADALRSFADANTQASLEVNEIREDEARTLGAVIQGAYQKTGSKNSVRLELERADYSYGDGTAPTTHATGHLALDLTKTLPRFQINLFVPQLDSLLSIMARQFAKRYGNAVTIKIKTAEKKKDAEGNWAQVKGSASFAVDMAKLPAGMAADNVFFQSGSITLDVNVTTGMRFDVTLVTNPLYRGFRAGEDGLKEKLAKVAARDEATLKEVEELYRRIDKNVGPIVEATVSPF
jgi:uncharacterized protein YxeA